MLLQQIGKCGLLSTTGRERFHLKNDIMSIVLLNFYVIKGLRVIASIDLKETIFNIYIFIKRYRLNAIMTTDPFVLLHWRLTKPMDQ